MNEEFENKEHCNCFCNSKGFRKFLIVALGSFVGVFCALSLFCALHRPPMMVPSHCHCHSCHCHCNHGFHHPKFQKHHKFNKIDKFKKDVEKENEQDED